MVMDQKNVDAKNGCLIKAQEERERERERFTKKYQDINVGLNKISIYYFDYYW